MIWKPHPGFQQAALALDTDEGLIGGAAGPGKSDVLLYGGLRDIGHPESRQLFLRKTYPELREMMDRSLRTFRSLGATWHEADKRWVFPSGATYEFGYCATYRDVTRYQGQEFTGIRFDEVGLIAEERIWTFLLSRLRSTDPTLRVEQRGSANPGGAGHAWLRRRFILPCDWGRRIYTDPETGLTRGFVPGRVRDNPSLSARYVRHLMAQPDRVRRALLNGDWNAGQGLALEELDPARHVIAPFPIPGHWNVFAGFDWGYRHPWWLAAIAASPDGDLFVFDAIKGRGQLPHEIARTIRERLPHVSLPFVWAGHDVFHDHKARGENTPTIADAMSEEGLACTPANISRIAGLNELRRVLAWRGTDLSDPRAPRDGTPRLRFFRTPPVLALYDQLQTIVIDENRPEDALKVDADPDTGEGGDDGYDALRYAIASRPLDSPTDTGPDLSAFDPLMLAADCERLTRSRGGTFKLTGPAHDAWEVFL